MEVDPNIEEDEPAGSLGVDTIELVLGGQKGKIELRPCQGGHEDLTQSLRPVAESWWGRE